MEEVRGRGGGEGRGGERREGNRSGKENKHRWEERLDKGGGGGKGKGKADEGRWKKRKY